MPIELRQRNFNQRHQSGHALPRFQHLHANETLKAVYCYQDFTFAVSDLADLAGPCQEGEKGDETLNPLVNYGKLT